MQGVIFIGLQASGKSSFFIQNFYKTHVRINMDMLKTRHRENIIFNACLASKQPCVIDNTNPTIAERARYIQAFKANQFKVTGYYFQSDLKACLERNSLRQGKEAIPEIGIMGTYKKLELPSYAEDFDEIHYVSINNFDFFIKEWVDEIY